MKLIGLTGGIGSGKSTVAGLFSTLGIPVYESDARAKDLMQTDHEVRQQIMALFGPDAFTEEEVLNRKWIASRVFTDPPLLEQLNAIVHPAVFGDLVKWVNEEPQQKAPYLIQESAILFEENLASRMTAVILVVASKEVRIARVMNRDGVSKEAVMERINHQWPDEKKIPLADFVIYNDGHRSLITQIMDIDLMIRSATVNLGRQLQREDP